MTQSVLRKRKQRTTWTFVPAKDVRKPMAAAVREIAKKTGEDKRGIRTRLLNAGTRLHLQSLAVE